MIETRVEDSTIHITGYVSTDAYEPLKEALSQVSSDEIVLSFDERCFINSTGLAVLMDLLLPAKDEGKEIRPRASEGALSAGVRDHGDEPGLRGVGLG